MKTQILSIEHISETEHSDETNILTLSQAPTFHEEKELFGDNEPIVLEF
ncbi:MAG: hypothetical protein ACQETL_19020 [Bacteroidota bacterium]